MADLALGAELRGHPELRGVPVAIAAGPGPRAEIVSVSAEARRAGVRPGSSVTHGRAACAGLRVRVVSPALDRSAREALLDAALSFSPRAAPAPPGAGPYAAEAAVHLDASGVTSLFQSERGFAAAVTERCRTLGLPAVVAVAPSRSVSLLAARALAQRQGPGAARVIAPGAEAAFLAPLPVDLLDPEPELAEALTRFGVHRLGELARLPRRALATRLGPGARELAALARGEAVEPPLPAPASRRFEEAADLEAPIDRLEPLAFVLRGLLSRLAERLSARGLACGGLDVTLGLEGGGRDARRVAAAAPTLDPKVLARLVGLALEARPPEAPVETLAVATEGAPVQGDQLDLFRPAGPTPAALGRTLAELEALCGAGRVGAPSAPDDHRPGAFALTPFEPPAPSHRDAARPAPGRSPPSGPPTRRPAGRRNGDPGDGADPGSRTRRLEDPRSPASRPEEAQASGDLPVLPAPAVRALRPPLSAEVRLHRGRPVWIRSAVASGHVEKLAGPWRTTGHWWSESERFAFDSFDVQTSDGSVTRLRLDRVTGTWHVDAVYD